MGLGGDYIIDKVWCGESKDTNGLSGQARVSMREVRKVYSEKAVFQQRTPSHSITRAREIRACAQRNTFVCEMGSLRLAEGRAYDVSVTPST